MRAVLEIDPSRLSTAQQKGARVVGRHVMFYTKPEVVRTERLVWDALKPLVGSFRAPEKAPCELRVTFFFGFPTGTPKARRVDGAPMTERPDCDNLVKAVADQLTDKRVFHKKTSSYVTERRFIPDDSQIYRLVVEKRRSSHPCVVIELNEAKTETPTQPLDNP